MSQETKKAATGQEVDLSKLSIEEIANLPVETEAMADHRETDDLLITFGAPGADEGVSKIRGEGDQKWVEAVRKVLDSLKIPYSLVYGYFKDGSVGLRIQRGTSNQLESFPTRTRLEKAMQSVAPCLVPIFNEKLDQNSPLKTYYIAVRVFNAANTNKRDEYRGGLDIVCGEDRSTKKITVTYFKPGTVFDLSVIQQRNLQAAQGQFSRTPTTINDVQKLAAAAGSGSSTV